MSRMIRATLFVALAIMGLTTLPNASAQTTVGVVQVSGRLPKNGLRVFSNDTLYQMSGTYIIDSGAALVIAPGTTVQFLPNSRIVDSTGGKIIADGLPQIYWNTSVTPVGSQTWCTILPNAYGWTNYPDLNALGQPVPAGPPYAAAIFAAANGVTGTALSCSTPYAVPFIPPIGSTGTITFRGVSVNQFSVEWGNILVLPGADSVFFRNCVFENMKKDTTVDQYLLINNDNSVYPLAGGPSGAKVLVAESNGSGGAITTFSHKTYLRNCTFSGNTSRIHGGAIAFLEFVASAVSGNGTFPETTIPSDDGRKSVLGGDINGSFVNNLTFTYNQLINPYTQATVAQNHWNVNECYGGAVYFGSRNFGVGVPSSYVSLTIGSNVTSDRWVFYGNTAINNQVAGASTGGAKGGAIYADTVTALTIYNGNFANNRATTPNNSANLTDALAFGGAIYADTALSLHDNCSFVSDTAGYGGAVYFSSGYHGTISRNLLVTGPGISFNNNVAFYNGDAVETNGDSTVFVGTGINDQNNQKVVFSGNVAGWAGGAIYDSNGANISFSVQWAEFYGNFVHGFNSNFHNKVVGGGAIYSTTVASILGTDFVGNHADTANGGAIYISNPAPNFSRSFGVAAISADTATANDTLSDPRELTRFIGNYAVRDTLENSPSNARFQSTGLGGAVFQTVPSDVLTFGRTDSTIFNRVRFEQNQAYSGAAVYSDLYDIRVIMRRCLIANNQAVSPIERTEPVRDTVIGLSSRIAGAILYGEVEGPLPSYSGSFAGNSIYDNDARFIVRLPDSPVLGIGTGGVDTMRGNFWGDGTDGSKGKPGIKGSPNVTIVESNTLITNDNFFVGTIPNTCVLPIPFESKEAFSYSPVPIETSIPDSLLFEGRVYDLLDKGTDIKTADYSNRVNTPVEDLALGEPRYLMSNLGPSKLQNIQRLTRDPYLTEVDSNYNKLQSNFTGPQPIGYPVFLRTFANVVKNNAYLSNIDSASLNYTVFFAVNKTTGECVRVNMKETGIASNEYRARLDLVPDSISRNPQGRAFDEQRPPFDYNQIGPLSRVGGAITLRLANQAAASYDDSLAVSGRRSFASNNPSIFQFNYPTDESLTSAEFYSGERYNALPVLVGDTIVIFSRTTLWKQGVTVALAQGISFGIGNVSSPVMVGDNQWLSQLPINANERFLIRDGKYQPTYTTYQYPNIPIFTFGGRDTNNFYDPRSLFQPTKYTQLSLSVNDSSGSQRLKYWLKDTTFYIALNEVINLPGQNGNPVQQNLNGSNGYITLYGQPHNPDIIPGGESVNISVSNFVPNRNVEDSVELVEPKSEYNNSIFLYPPYLNCDHLQTDTVLIPSQAVNYSFKILVADSTPQFVALYPATTANKKVPADNPVLVANLTDSLRYCFDINTDTYSEDSIAATQGWNFAYGRTSYSFGDPLYPLVAKIQPDWLAQKFMRDSNDASDPLGSAFSGTGLLKVSMDSLLAIQLITPHPQNNGALSMDTLASVVVNDGHTGENRLTYPVHVNVQPYIANTATLPQAMEDQDYNITMLDTTHAILGHDPNYGDNLTYYLVYQDTLLNEQQSNNLLDTTVFAGVKYDTTIKAYIIPTDNMYAAVAGKMNACKFWGVPNDTIYATTPAWLQINPVSGLLYGVPGINDVTFNANSTITAIVRDPYGLLGIAQIKLNVQPAPRAPQILGAPADLCEYLGDSVQANFTVSDSNLLRLAPYADSVTIIVTSNNTGVTINGQPLPYTVSSGQNNVPIHLNIRQSSGVGTPIIITIKATDNQNGASSTKEILVHLSNPVAWDVNLGVANNSGGFQTLTFGKGFQATDGIDTAFCEFVLPPVPPLGVFDARWDINDPKQGEVGTYNDFRDSTPTTIATWQSSIQAGGDVNQSYYPIYISWDSSKIITPKKGVPSEGQLFLKDQFGGSAFNVNMKTLAGAQYLGPQVQLVPAQAPYTVTLQVNNANVKGFFIVNDPLSAVNENDGDIPSAMQLGQNYPNPFTSSTNIEFALPDQQSTRLEVIDVMGRVIATLVNSVKQPGSYNVSWDGTDTYGNSVVTGVYFYRLTAGSHVEMKQMTIIK